MPNMMCLLQELREHTALDMPPEAILQRPSVVQHVLALLRPADKASSLPNLALQFLLCLVCSIKQALGMALDPEMLPAASGICSNCLPGTHKPSMQHCAATQGPCAAIVAQLVALQKVTKLSEQLVAQILAQLPAHTGLEKIQSNKNVGACIGSIALLMQTVVSQSSECRCKWSTAQWRWPCSGATPLHQPWCQLRSRMASCQCQQKPYLMLVRWKRM